MQVDLLGKETLSPEQAETLTEILEDLTAGRSSLLLYRGIAPAELRDEFTALPETTALRETLVARIRVAATANDADPLPSFAERRSRSRAYAALLERLAK
ncbi:MAG: hypothetical protein QM811_25325 [Pirellulales bacterium]